jgi:hypothetical protein
MIEKATEEFIVSTEWFRRPLSRKFTAALKRVPNTTPDPEDR